MHLMCMYILELILLCLQCQELLSFPYNGIDCCQSHTMSKIVDNPIQCQNCSQSHTMSGIIDSPIRCQKFVCNPIMSEIVDKSIQCQTLTILYNVPESWHSNINSSMYIHIKWSIWTMIAIDELKLWHDIIQFLK
jgi:hypothetical protein